MPRRIKLEPHLSPEELVARYGSAKNGVERSHYQIIWLLTTDKTTREVAEITGYSRAWLYDLVKSYNLQGAKALGDIRQHNRGTQALT